MHFTKRFWRSIVILPVALALSCGDRQNASSFTLTPAAQVNIDEQEQVLNLLPTHAELLSDSLFAAYFMDKRAVYVYNIYTGTLHGTTQNLDGALNFDSLMRGVMTKAELDSMDILPPALQDEDVPSSGGLQTFSVAGGKLYCFYSVPYRYKPKTEKGRQAILDMMPGNLREEYTRKNLDVTGDGYKAFLVETDSRIQIRSVTEIQYENFPRTKYGAYHIMPNGGFYVHDGVLYARIYDQADMLMPASAKKIKSSDSLPMIGRLKRSDNRFGWQHEVLNTSAIDDYSFPPVYYGFSSLSFREKNDTLLLSCEGGIFTLPEGKKYLLQKKLEPGEVSMGAFEIHNGRILYTAGKPSPKGYLKPDNMHFCIYNPATDQVEYKQPFPTFSFVRKNDTIVFMDKNKEHYFIARYAITEK
ncbi:MAG: hypothetical protein FD123_2691 [Bacteroidetes bacterium]|nr:MAG: hypothetical protein FD123_2691 [Bacteroidota bacterium]